MVFPKWHLSLRGLIWGFSLSVLPLEEKAEPTLKPTLSLFLGEPLSAGAMRSLPASVSPRVGAAGCCSPHLPRLPGVGCSGDLCEPVPGPGDTRGCSPSATPLVLWLTLSFCLQVYGARSLLNPASTGASVKLFSMGRRCASKYGGGRGFSSPPTKVLTCMLTLL